MIFISHVEEDATVAMQIAAGLEAAGFPTWYYERDGLPGSSYLEQIDESIDRCRAVVVVISPASINSNQVDKEIMRAHECGKPFVPVLRGLSHAEFQQKKRSWRMALGTSISIAVPPQGVETIVPQIVKGLERIGRAPSPTAPTETSSVGEAIADADEASSGQRFGTFAWPAVLGVIIALVGIAVWSLTAQKTPSPLPPSPTQTPISAARQLFKETPSFFDDFSASKLGAKWRVLEPDPKRWTLQKNPSSLLIITQKGSIWGAAKNLKNQFILDQPLPENCDVITKVSFYIQAANNSCSLTLLQDDDNYIELGYWGRPYLGIQRITQFTKEDDGQRKQLLAPAERGGGPAPAPETVFLKIERMGSNYNGYYSFVENSPPDDINNVRWTKIGGQVWINATPKVSLYADNGDSDAAEVGAQFEFVAIVPK